MGHAAEKLTSDENPSMQSASNVQPVRNRTGVYAALIVCAYVGVAGITTVYSLLSSLYRQFDDPVRIGWVVTAYYLVSAVSSALCGRIGDRIGRRRMTLAVLPVAALGAAISANSSTLNGVIAGCAIQGVAGALTPLGLGIAREAFASAEVPFAVGVIMASLVAGGGLSFWVAGAVIDHYSWSGGFYMKVVLAAVAIVATVRFIPDRRGSVNVTGESDLRALLKRQVLLANLCFALLCLGCMQHGQVLSLYLQQPMWTGTGFGLSASISGFVLLGLLSTAFVTGPSAGLLAARLGARRIALLGFVAGAIGWSANAIFHGSLWLLLAMCALGTVCISLVQTAAYTLIIQATPEQRTSEAVGLTSVLISVFMAVGAQLVTALLATSRISNTATAAGTFPNDQAYTLTFGFIALMSVFGIATSLALKGSSGAALVTGAAEPPPAYRTSPAHLRGRQ
jgi:MFS family permease